MNQKEASLIRARYDDLVRETLASSFHKSSPAALIDNEYAHVRRCLVLGGISPESAPVVSSSSIWTVSPLAILPEVSLLQDGSGVRKLFYQLLRLLPELLLVVRTPGHARRQAWRDRSRFEARLAFLAVPF